MRILLMTNLYPNGSQPIRAMFNRNEAVGLSANHEVRVIAPIAWTDEASLRLKRRWKRRVDQGPTKIVVEHPRYLFTPKVLRSRYGDFYRWSVQRAFRKAVREFKPEIVYAPWAYPDGWAATRLAREAGLPSIIKVHGSDVLLLDQHPARRAVTIDGLGAADGIVAVSADLATRLIDMGIRRDRIRVVYDSVDRSVFSPGSRADARQRLGLAADRPIALFVGNLVPVKGIDVLIDAMSRLANAGQCLDAYLVGQGPLRRELQATVNRLGLGDRVRFVGPVAHENLADWYRAANVMVLPSHSEGVPNVLLESASCGTPFVASRVGGIPEIQHLITSRLTPAGDSAALADAIREVVELPADRIRTEPNGILRGHVPKAQQLVTFFQEVQNRFRSSSIASVSTAPT